MAVQFTQSVSQRQTISPRQRLDIEMLGKSLPALREYLYGAMAENPCIEDIEPTLEKTTVSEAERAEEPDGAAGDSAEWPDDDDGGESAYSADADAMERRRRFLESQAAEETLEEHLMAEIRVSDIPESDKPLAEILAGELDGNGYFAGSVPDLVMVTGESEEKILSVLSMITALDPPGCGARSLSECLLAQVEKLDGAPGAGAVRGILEKGLLEAVAAGDYGRICSALSISRDECRKAVDLLKSLEPKPARAYPSRGKGVEFVNPEVHAVKGADGRWMAEVDERSLPEIRISQRYLDMLKDSRTDDETKQYIKGRIAAANLLVDAVARRQETVRRIAQAIFDAQSGFFTGGLKALKPLTMSEIARKADVHETTVSRTVRDKYASTPKGTVELRRFFTGGGFAAAGGESVTKDSVEEMIKEMIGREDRAKPLSDDAVSKALSAKGLSVARRTVAKYRSVLGIPSASERRR